jgi:hypothetical protein
MAIADATGALSNLRGTFIEQKQETDQKEPQPDHISQVFSSNGPLLRAPRFHPVRRVYEVVYHCRPSARIYGPR